MTKKLKLKFATNYRVKAKYYDKKGKAKRFRPNFASY